ncbi:Flp family type IVb pilin [Thermoflexus sp.]|uniref:Flp family type IVb pilin n=1 Tax=Thermoflexus sp. TaxID=1969742 RepID=UPI0017AD444E|nr:Flp family type IVb pilin [Thermoflexus sp.]
MVRWLQAWLGLREKGQGLVEYALILALIAVVVIIILSLLGTQVSQVFSQIASTMQGS